MGHEYTDASRENETHSLPDVEVWYHEHAKRERCMLNAGHKAELYGECILDEEGDCYGTGWYYQYSMPGYMPDSEPCGPFATEAEALKQAREDAGFCEHGVAEHERCEVCDAQESE